MNVIINYTDLEGKTISFAHMAQFANQITLATTEGDVLMAAFEGVDADDLEIRVFNKYAVIGVLQQSEYLREELDKLGIFNLKEWKKQKAAEEKKLRENLMAIREQEERKEFERLRAKFEK